MAPVASVEEYAVEIQHTHSASIPLSPSPAAHASGYEHFTYAPTSRISKQVGTSDGLKPSLAQATTYQASATNGATAFSTSTSDSATIATNLSTSTNLPRPDSLPDLPVWFGYMLAGWLAFLAVAAIVLYFVTFPPRWLQYDLRRKRQEHFIYGDFLRSSDAYELDRFGKPQRVRITPAGVSTSADSPALGHGEWQSGLRKRPRAQNLSVDTSAAYIGLSIAVPGIDRNQHVPSPALKVRDSLDSSKSYRARSDSSDSDTSSTNSARPLNRSWHAVATPQPAAKHFFHSTKAADAIEAARCLRYRTPDDEETGLEKPIENRVARIGYRTPWPGPNGSPPLSRSSTPKSSAARVRCALEKVSTGFEWGADKFAKMLHDQVKDDYEDGLLLPIRNDEREKMHVY